MHSLFLKWFFWGFYSKVIITGLMLVTAVMYMVAESSAVLVGGVSCGLFIVQYIVWLIVGAIWRFSRAGVTASGDRLEKDDGVSDAAWAAQLESAQVTQGYQYASGSFMKIYLMVALYTYSILLGVVIIAGLYSACSGTASKEDGEADNDNED